MSVVIKGSEPFDIMIASNIANCQTANIKFKNISFRCETIEDADGTVFVKMPPTQPIEPKRKNGRWLPDNNNYITPHFVCSACGMSQKVETVMYEPIWAFCPRCGARMMKEGD